ncbi:uncharacterized protein LOC127804833 [Diospyros lotus]|uniref:uncharacterized protein LOC127804833 n=1 Tax=Diospyros lotus TaxID=55363 RepID=UPI00224F21E3|nr:uncharacterized protein LOC127804833 [Diospyros lotus]XP_052197831.1 uncharacterized protein LOC127804833 [Diospyros lotus]
MEVLRKAYADAILNTGKEAATRIRESELKAIRFQRDLRFAKAEAIRMLLRMKRMLDSKTAEAENKSLSQQKRIEELEAQLDEAEEIILDLRAELTMVQDRLDMAKNNHMWPPKGLVEKQDDHCHKDVEYQKLEKSSPISYHTKSSCDNITSELQSKSLNEKNMEHADLNIPKKPELYNNGCIQRVCALEKNFLEGVLVSEEVRDQHFLMKNEPIINVNEQNTEIPTATSSRTEQTDLVKSPTQLEENLCTNSCIYEDRNLTPLDKRIMDWKVSYSAKKSAPLKSNLENSVAHASNFCLATRGEEPELFKNGYTLRGCALEKDLIDGELASEIVDAQQILMKSKSTTKLNEQNTEIHTASHSNTHNVNVVEDPTPFKDKLCISSCTYMDQPLKVYNIRRRRTEYKNAKAISLISDPNLVKPHGSTSLLSQCRTSSYTDNDNAKACEGACSLPYDKSGYKEDMEEEVQHIKDQAIWVVHRSPEKGNISARDAVASSCWRLPNQLSEAHSTFFHCNAESVNCNVDSCEYQTNSESGTAIETGVAPIPESAEVTHTEAGREFTGNDTDKDAGSVVECLLVKEAGDVAGSPRVHICKPAQIDDKRLMGSKSNDAKAYEAVPGTSSLADSRRPVIYTFSRKRKKETLVNPVNTFTENNSMENRTLSRRLVLQNPLITKRALRSSTVLQCPLSTERVLRSRVGLQRP